MSTPEATWRPLTARDIATMARDGFEIRHGIRVVEDKRQADPEDRAAKPSNGAEK